MADLLNPLKQVASSITGSVEKGYLLVRREIIQETNDKKAASGLGGLGALDPGLSGLSNAIKDTSNILNNSTTLLGNNNALTSAANRSGYITIKVQYNPSSIRFTGSRGTAAFDHNGMYVDNPRPADNIMSLDLYFDTEDNATAFMLDKTAVDLAKGAAGGLYNSITKDVNTVRYIVELLIGATVFNSTRWIGFAWKDIEFWGELIGVNATYLMFDVSGEPVRAKVSLRIRQNTSNITNLKDNGEKEKAENRIADDKDDMKKLKALGKKKSSWTSSVSNILNL